MLFAAIAGSGLVFGAQQPGVLVTVALLSAGAMFCLRPAATPRLAWLLFGLACFTLLQIIPLPFAWVAALSPSSAEVWRGALDPFGEPAPKWISLSVDPAATALEVLKWFGYACVFVAGAGLRARRGPVLLAMLVTGSALAVCLVTLTHGIFDIQHIYGLYQPTDTSQWLRGPFVNGNNLTGYLNLGLFAGIGLWLAPDKKYPTWPLILAVPLMVVEVLLASSRGGVGALILGLLVIGYWLVRRRRLVSSRVRNSVVIALVAGVGLALAIGSSRIGVMLADRDVQGKVNAWRWSLHLIRDFPIFGAGRGAFETAFEPYRQPIGFDWTMVFVYVENFPLQWAADWGVPVTLAAFALWALLTRRSIARALESPLGLGVAVGIGAILLQNLVDLAFELFGVFALVVVALSAIVEPARAGEKERVPVGLLAGIGVLIGALVVVSTGAAPARFERARVSHHYAEWVRSGAKEPQAFLGELKSFVLRHPGEAYFPLVGSAVASRAGKDPIRWIGRALERSPLDGHAHFRLAEVLAARGARRQALLHLRLAALYDVLVRDAALAKASGLAKNADDLLSAFPRDLPGGSLLPDVCKRALGPARVACWREVILRNGADAAPRRELAAALLDSIETGTAPCAGEGAPSCVADVRRLLGELAHAKDDWRVAELQARELAAQGKIREAAALLVERCPAKFEALECCLRAVEVASRARDLKLLGSAADRYSAVVCNEPRHCAVGHERIGQAYAAIGAHGTALKHFTAAAEHEPSADRWIQNAEAAARAGLTRSAEVALERARREGNLDPERLRRIEAAQELIRNAPER